MFKYVKMSFMCLCRGIFVKRCKYVSYVFNYVLLFYLACLPFLLDWSNKKTEQSRAREEVEVGHPGKKSKEEVDFRLWGEMDERRRDSRETPGPASQTQRKQESSTRRMRER